ILNLVIQVKCALDAEKKCGWGCAIVPLDLKTSFNPQNATHDRVSYRIVGYPEGKWTRQFGLHSFEGGVTLAKTDSLQFAIGLK
ncbi:MAG: hypothetical protein NTW28_17245, partial [Candidatus Solibacter sp.]|nr:hypothetical protein [Candidatus Solibacter sp.]